MLKREVHSNDRSCPAKIVDLDPANQSVSMIYGLRFTLCDNVDDPTSRLSGVMKPVCFRDLNYARSDRGDQGIEFSGAIYQSVIILDEDVIVGSSAFLNACEEYIERTKTFTNGGSEYLFPRGAVSVSFRVSGFNGDHTSNTFCHGEIVGFIQPWLPDQPFTFDICRMLIREDRYAYAYLQRCKKSGKLSVNVNIFNSFVQSNSTDLMVAGPIVLGYKDAKNNIHEIGPIGYNEEDKGWVSRTALTVDIPVPPKTDVEELRSSPFVLYEEQVLARHGGKMRTVDFKSMFCEADDGYYCRLDDVVHRLQYDEIIMTEVYATKFGKRVDNGTSIRAKLNRKFIKSADKIEVCGNAGSNNNADEYLATVTTNNGVAKFSIKNLGPGRPRGFIENQVYTVEFAVQGSIQESNPLDTVTMANLLFFDQFMTPEKPSWLVDILPILKAYAQLYPSMSRIVQLDNFGSVVSRRWALKKVFSKDKDDSAYMPVTRDLSDAKRTLLLQWLSGPEGDGKEDPLYMNTDNMEDLKQGLQTALELEHATMPPYLTALFSIKEGHNQYVYDAIKDVVMEEMLHFALVGNIMIALGFHPQISSIAFVPKFPGSLPGGLRQDLIVHLRKCSRDQLKMFMNIESPEKQNVEVNGVIPVFGKFTNKQQTNLYTIGFLYNLLILALENPSIDFPGLDCDPNDARVKHQVTVDGAFGGKLTKIKTKEDAIAALQMIKEEGEGASPIDFTDPDPDAKTEMPELAHYYRFAEIVHGKRLVKTAMGYSYSGPEIILDEDGIYNMQDDPNMANLPRGSAERTNMEMFARKYQAMLNGLHTSFNGKPENITTAISAMFSLTISAKGLMEMPLPGDNPNKETVGVSFQLPFTRLEN